MNEEIIHRVVADLPHHIADLQVLNQEALTLQDLLQVLLRVLLQVLLQGVVLHHGVAVVHPQEGDSLRQDNSIKIIHSK